ncbi:MAG: DUF3987 domain-containing protein [Candidatus Kapabacteria bacterium]|nr:DUF3987 domain-containing protein [Candidatus Kapabacteria bacterium]
MRLVELGLTATTNTGGAGKWKAEYSRFFNGARVVIVGDVDEAGRQHVQQVVASLLEHGDLESLRIVDLTTLGRRLSPKADVSDFLDAGGSIHEVTMAAERAPELVVADHNLVEHANIDVIKLPPLLQKIVTTSEDIQDQTTLLMSCIVALGSFMTTVITRVAGHDLNPMMYLMIVGAAGTGKGLASVSRDLVNDIHQSLKDEYSRKCEIYEIERERYSLAKGDPKGPLPKQPSQMSLIMPGNSTAPVILEAMGNNPPSLIHETEADVMASMLKADYGDMSGVLRQSYTHEPVSFARARLAEVIEVNVPRLSLCISGTPGQVGSFFRDGENGLVSRFCFHILTRRSKFKDQFDGTLWNVQSIGKYFAPKVASLYRELSALELYNIEVCFTAEQLRMLRPILEAADSLAEDDGDSHTATVRRNAILIARVATVLTITRFIEVVKEDHLTESAQKFLEGKVRRIEVEDLDFETALALGQYALRTARLIADMLPATTIAAFARSHKGAHEWYSSLSREINRKDAVDLGIVFGMSARTVDRKLKDASLFSRTKLGSYSKTLIGKVAT